MEALPWGLINARTALDRGETPDAIAAAFAAAQHGAATTAQLRFGGLSKSAIATRRARGTLVDVHRGVVAVGIRSLDDLGRVAAAVLACGEGSLASHRAAGFLLGGLKLERDLIEISVAAAGRRGRFGIRVHEAASIGRRDRRTHQRIPHTSPARTVLDIAESEGSEVARTLLNHLRQRQRVSRDDFVDLYRRTPGRRGWKALLPLVRERDFDRSGLEVAMKELIEKAGLRGTRRETT